MSGIKYTLLTDFVENIKSRLLAINGANVDRSQEYSLQTAQENYKPINGSISDEVESMDVTSDSEGRRRSLKRCSDCSHNQTSPKRSRSTSSVTD